MNSAGWGDSAPMAAYLAVWRAYRRYFRYSVTGLENMPTDRAALIVGYHGRPVAYDLCILLVEIYERHGYFPHAVVHGAMMQVPSLRWLAKGLRFVAGDGEDIANAVKAAEHVVVLPGGTREGCRSHHHRYQVAWGPRTGYLRLAAKYGLPVVPVAAHGVDDAYVGLNDGYAWGKRLKMPARLPFWLGLGPVGLWPASPPFPVRIRQRVGAPIHLPRDLDTKDEQAMMQQHQRVRAAVQSLLDEGKKACA